MRRLSYLHQRKRDVEHDVHKRHRTPTNLLDLFTFTPSLGSSVLLQTSACSGYHTVTQSPVVIALSLTKPQLHGTTPRFYPSRILCQFFQIFLESLSLFQNYFFSSTALRCLCMYQGVCVCLCVCVCVCVCACVRARTWGACVFELLTA